MTDEYQKESRKAFKPFLSLVMAILTAAGLIFGLAVAVPRFVDSRVESKIHDEQFIRQVASQVRPFVIFDDKGSILVDGGACESLEHIDVSTGKPEGTTSVKIVVTPKYHLPYAPLVEKLGAGRFIHSPETKRGPGHQWIYDFEVVHWEDDPVPLRFRLEILR